MADVAAKAEISTKDHLTAVYQTSVTVPQAGTDTAKDMVKVVAKVTETFTAVVAVTVAVAEDTAAQTV
jgi:hypothetical protein